MHEPAWLAEVVVEQVEGMVQVVVLLNFDDPLIRRCLPNSIDGIKVVARLL